MVKGCVMAGGAGVSIGRNAFQHRDPEKIIRVINKLVHNGSSVEDGLNEMAA
jgi:class I fructose-bisphosphate aldolase